MRRLSLALAAAVVVMAAAEARAQGQAGGRRGGGGFETLFLLGQKSVQTELKLSDDQVKQVTELAEKQRASFGALQSLSREDRRAKRREAAKASETAIAGILKEDQVKRLKQISLQQRGGRALDDEEVATALQLTNDQKQKINTIQEQAQAERGTLLQGGDREAARPKLEALRKATNEKVMAVLTSDQQAKWKELCGEPFTGEIRRPDFGGRNRPSGA